jgi:hypothetical protein
MAREETHQLETAEKGVVGDAAHGDALEVSQVAEVGLRLHGLQDLVGEWKLAKGGRAVMLLEPPDDIGEAVRVCLGERDEVAAPASRALEVAQDRGDGSSGMAEALAVLDEEEAHCLVREWKGAKASTAAEGLEAAREALSKAACS